MLSSEKGGDSMINEIETAIDELEAIQHILLHIASSEYLKNSHDIKVCQLLSKNVGDIKKKLEGLLE